MTDCPGHGGMLPIRDAKLFSGLPHNPRERTIVGVANEWAQMMDDVMVEPANEPAYDWVFRRIVGCCREDVIDTVVKLAAIRREVGAVDSVCGLEYQRHGQSDDQMDQHERPNDQKRRLPQHEHGQNEHVSEVESLPRKKDGIFSRRMPGAFQIFVGREEKALKVSHENVVEREHRIKKQSVDVLEPVMAHVGLIRRKPKDAASRKRVVFALEIDAGVVPTMMENSPHVRADSANIENIVQGFVYGGHRRDSVVVAVVGDVQQKECLGKAAKNVQSNESP